jgi:hypothetical protein
MRSLVMSFRGILQSGRVRTLARWMKKANGSGIYGMKRFVRKLKHDLAAVKNALRESWSNGPVEGHINRQKTLKRQMYGRAGFELLRARLLPMFSWLSAAPKLRKNLLVIKNRGCEVVRADSQISARSIRRKRTTEEELTGVST